MAQLPGQIEWNSLWDIAVVNPSESFKVTFKWNYQMLTSQ